MGALLRLSCQPSCPPRLSPLGLARLCAPTAQSRREVAKAAKAAVGISMVVRRIVSPRSELCLCASVGPLGTGGSDVGRCLGICRRLQLDSVRQPTSAHLLQSPGRQVLMFLTFSNLRAARC